MRIIFILLLLIGCGKSEDAMMDRITENEKRINKLQDRLNVQQAELEVAAYELNDIEQEIALQKARLNEYSLKADTAFNAIQLKIEEQNKMKPKRKKK